MLSDITPVILTLNEAANLERSLERISWAKDIVIVDSGSSDETLKIARNYPQVRLFERDFDTHVNQWRYALHDTKITTPWILRLDADFIISEALIEELSHLQPDARVAAFDIGFDYAIHGHKLRGSLYPARPVLLRLGQANVYDRGHTEAWEFDGEIRDLKAKITHDDRKRSDRWLTSQVRYMILEADRLTENNIEEIRLSDRLRRVPLLMPVVSFFYCLFIKGLIWNGRFGLNYAVQRLVAESILSFILLDASCRKQANRKGQS